jgi:hypothetical protein
MTYNEKLNKIEQLLNMAKQKQHKLVLTQNSTNRAYIEGQIEKILTEIKNIIDEK